MDARPCFGSGAAVCVASDSAGFAAGAALARLHGMDSKPPAYIELDLDDDDEPPTGLDSVWLDEKTQRLDFERAELSDEARLVIGYLTLEEHGMFAGLSLEEQQQFVNTLKRSGR